jgi:S-DNA-T family DNA segregation ATPase FtsK/SpoIIIE
VGNTFVYLFRFFMGEWFILCLVSLFSFGISVFWKKKIPTFFTRRKAGIYCIVASILLLSHILLFQNAANGIHNPSVIRATWELFQDELNGQGGQADLGGGMIGAVLFAASYFLFASFGSRLVAILLILIGIVLITDKSLQEMMKKFGGPVFRFFVNQWTSFIEDIKQLRTNAKSPKKSKPSKKQKVRKKPAEENEIDRWEQSQTIPSEPIISSFSDRDDYEQEHLDSKESREQKEPETTSKKAEPDKKPDVKETISITFSEPENMDYQLPSIESLSQPAHSGQLTDKKNIYENARKLERTFQSFGVKAKVTQVHLGPAVTKYEVYPDVGVKVSKIVNLSDDLALALAAKDIRIEAPIPGKSAIGIEVPNAEVAMVSLREVLESKLNDRPDAKLLIGLGRNISGEAVLAELNKMPHLLVAGATGSGKSVCVNGIIISILMRAKPHEVKLMMIDPKMVELNVYNGIPHLLAPVVTDPKKASQALKKVVNEMERRYEYRRF